jgi:hypothetical protein
MPCVTVVMGQQQQQPGRCTETACQPRITWPDSPDSPDTHQGNGDVWVVHIHGAVEGHHKPGQEALGTAPCKLVKLAHQPAAAWQ